MKAFSLVNMAFALYGCNDGCNTQYNDYSQNNGGGANRFNSPGAGGSGPNQQFIGGAGVNGGGMNPGMPGYPGQQAIPVTQLPSYAVPQQIQVPDFEPACIAPLVFTKTLSAGVTTAYIDDFTGIASQLGALPGATFEPFTGPGSLTPTNMKNWLATRALFVNSFNLQSTTAADVQRSINVKYYNLDGTNTTKIISNSMYAQSINPVTTLINNPNGWVWMDNSVILVSGTAGATLTLTVNISASAGYGNRRWSNYYIPAGSAVCSS